MQAPFPSSAAIEVAIARTLAAAGGRGMCVHKIEYIAPSENWCKSIALIVFFETDANLRLAFQDGSQPWLRTEFLNQLKASANVLPFDQMPEDVAYEFDSHETVVRDYKGSYFLRLR